MKQTIWSLGGLGLLNFCLQIILTSANPAFAEPIQPSISSSPPLSTLYPSPDLLLSPEDLGDDSMRQMRSVDELSDIQPSDWAFQALKALVERYGVITGYPDRTFRGNRPLSRYEFAAILTKVLEQIEQMFTKGELAQLREDFATVKRLQDSYGATIFDLRDRIKALESTTNKLEQQQFSTTTTLGGQTVLALTDGTNSQTTILTRVRLNLNTSFSGSDLLRTQLEVGNNGGDAISRYHDRGPNLLGTLGLLADGGGLDYVAVENTVRISKLYYSFQPVKNLTVAIGSSLNPRDFIDRNKFADDSLTNFSSSFFMSNPLIVQNPIDRPGGAGVVVIWQPSDTLPLTLKALYAAADANFPDAELTKGGLFGDHHQASLELEYTFSKDLVARLQYTRATINSTAINAGGFNFEWVISRQFAMFGRFGFGSYNGFNSRLNQNLDLSPITWAIGGTIRDIGIPGSIAGVAIGQPFAERNVGDATQTNFELYYSFKLNDSISFSPALLVVANPNNRSIGTVWEWVARLVYSF